MSAHDRQATRDYIKEMEPQTPPNAPSPSASRAPIGPWALAASGIALAGVALAVAASFSTVIKIQVLTVVPDGGTFTGLDRYGPALLVLAGFGLLMIIGAIRGSRPAMAAVALTGVGVLLVAVLVDVPHIHDTGVWPKNDLYEDAQANPGTGFYMETAAGVLLLLGGALMLLLAGHPAKRERTPAPRRPDRSERRDPELESRYDRERQRERAARLGEGSTEPEPASAPAAASFEIPELPSSLPPEPSSAARFAEPTPTKRRRGGLVDRLGLRKR